MPTTPLQDAIINALNLHEAEGIVEGVKDAVITEIEALDPAVKIKKTDYFNHSFAPDLHLTWKSGARREEERELYLRYSFKASHAARDVDMLGKSGAIFLSMNYSHDDDDNASSIADEVGRAPRSLFTNASAIDQIADETTSPPGAADPGTIAPPLLNLFRRNVVRGGRGLIASDTAELLGRSLPEPSFNSNYIDVFTATVTQVFDEAASFRLKRAAQLIQAAVSGDMSMFEDESSSASRGKLDDTELRAILPFILERASTIPDMRFWRHVGELMTLDQLESMASLLSDFNLGPLAQNSLDSWRGARSIMSYNPDAIDETERPEPRWHIRAGVLCASAGVWNVHFSTNNQRGGRPRTDSTLPNWEDVSSISRGLPVSKVRLNGVARNISVESDEEQPSDIRGDVEMIQDTIDDTFFVKNLTIRSSAEDATPVDLDFATMTASGTSVPVADLAKFSFRVLGYRFPLADFEESALLGDEPSSSSSHEPEE